MSSLRQRQQQSEDDGRKDAGPFDQSRIGQKQGRTEAKAISPSLDLSHLFIFTASLDLSVSTYPSSFTTPLSPFVFSVSPDLHLSRLLYIPGTFRVSSAFSYPLIFRRPPYLVFSTVFLIHHLINSPFRYLYIPSPFHLLPTFISHLYTHPTFLLT